MLFTWPLLSQACLMLFSPCAYFKADFLVQVLVCVRWWFLCWAPSLATPVTWAASFLESSALKITHQLLSVGYTFQPLVSRVRKALWKDLFWNGIIMTSSGQVATSLLTCTDGDSFSSQIQFFSTQTSLTFSSMIVVLWPFNHKLVKLSLKISLNNLERRECDSLSGLWFLMPSQHRNFPNHYLTKSCPNLIQPFNILSWWRVAGKRLKIM